TRHDAVEILEPADELRGGLLPHPWDARQPIRRITAQHREIAVGAAGNSVAALDLGLIHHQQLADALLRVEDADVGVTHEGKEVAVAGDNFDLTLDYRQERGDHVFSFEAFGADDLDADRRQHGSNDWLLRRKLGRHSAAFQPRRFVAGNDVDPKSRTPILVRGDDDRPRLSIADQTREHVEEATNR